jgi:DNA processing protein
LNNLRSRGLSVIDLFDLNESTFAEYFPDLGKGRLSKTQFTSLHQLDEEKLLQDYQKLKEQSVHLITIEDERYPKSVLESMQDAAPPILFCRGYLNLLNERGISIVGARDVDESAISITKNIALTLAEHGYNVTSGYAKGIDTAAHSGALEAGGTTTIILSYGINQIFIKKELKESDWERSALFISQFSPDDKFSPGNAMMRNKLVCAMSKAIVVISSGPEIDSEGRRSGTFDAGKSALKMGIPTFVLCQNLLNPIPKGNAELIKLGGNEFSKSLEIIKELDELISQLHHS